MLSLPLAKLSVADDADPAKQKFTWKHEQHDLAFVLDSYGTLGSSQLLKVVQGTQVRQVVELELLINEGDEMTKTMRDRGVELKAEHLPVSAIVRCPLLAIRWQLPNKLIRRAQLKFKSSEDFDTAYKHLHQLGLRMSSSNDSQTHNPLPSPSLEHATPPSARSSLIAAAYPHQSASGSLSCPPSRLSEISNRPYTATNAPTLLESKMQEATCVRPTSAYSGYISEPNTGGPFPGALVPPVYFVRPASATSDILGRATNTSVFSPHDQPISTIEEVPRSSSSRPETAMLYNHPDIADSLLPPRRELPFQRSSVPRSSGSDTVRPSSRPSTGLMGPPPLPARVASLRPSSSPGKCQGAELAPLPRPTVIDRVASRMQVMPKPSRTPNEDNNIPMLAQTPSFGDSENHNFPSSSPNSSPLLLHRASSQSHPSLRPLSPFSPTSQNSGQTMSQNALPTSEATYQAPMVSPGNSSSNNNTEDNLAAYAMQSEEGRRAALNEFVFRHLESDDFLTLVEDMETCWARVTLGMR